MRNSKTKSRTLTGREATSGPRTKTLQQNSEVRLNKYLADAGVCSRRHADDLITEGQVMINGKKVYELGAKIIVGQDRVVVSGKPVELNTVKITMAFNKPKGVLTTMSDPHGRPCIADYLDRLQTRVFPVGRLDYDSEGLMILTNDGDLAQMIMHPKHEVPKTYMVKVSGQPTEQQLQKLKRGVTIIGGRVAAKEIERVKGTDSDKYDWLKVVITEGKNRQIRRMFEKIGFDVMKLQRVAIGKLKLGSLARGECVALMPDEVARIFSYDRPRPVPAARGGDARSDRAEARGATGSRGSGTRPIAAAAAHDNSGRPEPRSTYKPAASKRKLQRRPKSAKSIARDIASRRG